MNKLVDWKNRLKDRHMLSVVVVLFAIIIAMGIWIYKKPYYIGFLKLVYSLLVFYKSIFPLLLL